jgi:hypothetical protein
MKFYQIKKRETFTINMEKKVSKRAKVVLVAWMIFSVKCLVAECVVDNLSNQRK